MQQPVQHAVRLPDPIDPSGSSRPGSIRVLHAAHQHQPHLGACHGHIEHTSPLGPFGATLLQRNRALQERRAAGARPLIDIPQSEANLAMQAKGARLCAPQQRTSQPHYIHRGKFQPLGFVDGHHTHHILPGIHHGGALFPPAAAICPHGFHKSMQAVRVALLIGVGPVTEHAQICLPQLSARLCAVMCIKSAALEKTPQVFGQRHAARIKPLGLQRVQHGAATSVKGRAGLVGRRLQRAEEAGLPLGTQQPDGCQLSLRKLKERAAQLAEQRHIIGQIIQQCQVLKHLIHLVGRHGVAAAFAVHGNAHTAEHQLHLVGHVLAHGQENGDVTIVERCAGASLSVGDRLAHRCEDVARDEFRLGQDHILRPPPLGVEHMQFGCRVSLGGYAGIQPCVGIIVNFRDTAVHHVREHAVHRIQHSGPAAEIQVQHHPAAWRVLPGRKALQLAQEQARLCQAEPVNALLYIAHIKIGLPLAALEGVEDGLLQGAHVLIFVHEHRIEPPRLLAAQVRIAQHGQRHMFKIAEIDACLAELARLKAVVKAAHRFGQPTRGRPHGLHIRRALFKIRGQQLFQVIRQVLDPVAQVLKFSRQAFLVSGRGLEAPQGGKLQGSQRPAQGAHPFITGRSQPIEASSVALQGPHIGRGKRRICTHRVRLPPEGVHSFQNQRCFPAERLGQRLTVHGIGIPLLGRALLQPGHRVGA